MSYVLFDIGGTKTRVAISEDLRTISAQEKFNTPSKYKEGLKAIEVAVRKLTDKPIRGVAGGIRGQLGEGKIAMVHDTLLIDWIDQPLVTALAEKLSSCVYLENDAALAALGEATFGAGQGAEIMVYHTVSTGVGGAKVERGQIDDASSGFEPGHQILDIDHTILGEGVEPTLENLVSGSAVEERMGIKPYEIDQQDKIWDQLAYYLAHGLRNSILYWSPDVIVLGGSMIVGNPRILLDDIIKHTNSVVGEVALVPLIVDAKLGDEAGLFGALALLNQKV